MSSGLIALAFIGQLSRLGTAFYTFGLILLPTLAFTGVTTFERALRNGVEDVQLVGRINRIRQFYFDTAPQVSRYLPAPVPDTLAAIAVQAGVSSPSWYQFLTIAGALAVVDSVLIGAAAGLAVQAGTGTLVASAAAGVIMGGRGAGRALGPAAGDLAGRSPVGNALTRPSGPLTTRAPGRGARAPRCGDRGERACPGHLWREAVQTT